MNSFDVFDTLIARRYIHSDYIWKKMGQEIDIPNFEFHRKQSNYGSFYNIYNTLANKGVIPKQLIGQMMELELQYEQDTVFPIKENMDKVSHGDLLVSDMYLPASDILRLVRSCSLDKQVTIYASLADKHHGHFWRRMRGRLAVEYHIGDNDKSDIELAAKEGFKVVHYTKSNIITGIEGELQGKGLRDLAMLIREVRLRNFEPEAGDVFSIAAQLNLPWLFICSEILRRRLSHKRLVFLGRDCQLMYWIYSTFFDKRCYYLPLSRRTAYADPESTTHYLRSHLPEEYMIVDISSTGKTWDILSKYHNFNVMVLHYDGKHGKAVPPGFAWISQADGPKRGTNLLLEAFNCADHGMLDKIEIVNGLPLAKFEQHTELYPDWIKVVQTPIKQAMELLKFYPDLALEMRQVSDQTLLSFFDSLPRSICKYQDMLRVNVLKDFYDKHNAYANELGPI